MLDQNSLSQLSQLKKDILATKDYAEGVVVGANGRFGFVKLDDGRTAFLNPERMQRVLPGDRVRINVVPNDKKQLEAELEVLLETNKEPFVATYRIKEPNHFVQSESRVGNRWLFVPPPFRKRCKDGDYVLAEMNKHPFEDGKASVRIVTRIGAPGEDFLQHKLVIANYNLGRYWSKDAQKQADDIAQNMDLNGRQDFTDIPFVTIDAESTRDMDDAIFAAPSEGGGWTLQVAIADPGHFVSPGSPLAKAARAFAQSVYLPGRTLSMLPETLATDVFSLGADCERPALVARILISQDGEIQNCEFAYGIVRSRAKLTYNDVAAFLQNPQDPPQTFNQEIQQGLQHAYDLARSRFAYRQEHNLTHDEHADYDLQLNKHGSIEHIAKRDRNEAHRLVEEAMLATNLCAGKFLAEHNSGVFSVQLGFRPERLGEVKAVLREDIGEEVAQDTIQELTGHVALIKHLQQDKQHTHLLAPLKRMMQGTEISTKAAPHMGMGVDCYATITSPIRRYTDLCNHWSMIQILSGKAAQSLPDRVLEQLQETLQRNRQASRHLELSLVGQYLQDRIGLEGKGAIRIITQQGFGVKLEENGIEGFVQFPKKMEKQFDAKRMTLRVEDCEFVLDQLVGVRVTAVDLERRRVKMELLDPIQRAEQPSAGATTTAD